MDRTAQLLKMLESDPKDTFCMYALALEYGKLGQTQQALEWFDRTLAANPSDCYAYFHKAKTLHESGDRPAAIQTLESGLTQARVSRDHKALSEIEAFLDELQE